MVGKSGEVLAKLVNDDHVPGNCPFCLMIPDIDKKLSVRIGYIADEFDASVFENIGVKVKKYEKHEIEKAAKRSHIVIIQDKYMQDTTENLFSKNVSPVHDLKTDSFYLFTEKLVKNKEKSEAAYKMVEHLLSGDMNI